MSEAPLKAIEVLEHLEKLGGIAFVKQIEEKGLAHSAIMRSILFLEENNHIKKYESKKDLFILTKRGKEAVKDGLPERNLIRGFNGKNKMSFSELKIKNVGVALAQAKKLNLISIGSNKTFELTKSGKNLINNKSAEEIALKNIENGKIRKDVLKNLLERGLIENKVQKTIKISILPAGKELLKKGIIKTITSLDSKLIRSRDWKKVKFRAYNVKDPVKIPIIGKKHVISDAIEYVRNIWLEMGFKEMTGPMLDTNFWVFDALYQPQDHPARDMQDTLFMKIPSKGRLPSKELVNAVKNAHETGGDTQSTGWGYKWNLEFAKKCILRTHTTSLSARTLAQLRKDVKENNLPAKYFSVGRTFRNETLDWKHLIEFHQTDGIVVGESVNFRQFLFYLRRYFQKLGFQKVRFRPAYFPYTEMSTEIEVFHPVHKKWLELGGAGMFRPEVVKPLLGKDIPVLAWGPGFERILMVQYELNDIRKLYNNDLKESRERVLWGAKCLR